MLGHRQRAEVRLVDSKLTRLVSFSSPIMIMLGVIFIFGDASLVFAGYKLRNHGT